MADKAIDKVYVQIGAMTSGLVKGLNTAKAMVSSAARTLAVPLSLAGAGATYGLVQGLRLSMLEASNLGESISKTNAVLGQSGEAAVKFAQEMAAAGKNGVGPILDGLTNTTMALRANMVGKDMAENLAKAIEERKVDMASFFNVDARKIQEDIQSAMSGQLEVLRKYNIFLDADSVKAGSASLAEGVAKAFLKGTQVAKGDFERTKNSLANMSRATGVMSGAALASVGESFYGLGQAIEVVKQTFWSMVSTFAAGGVFTAIGESMQATVLTLNEVVKSLSDEIQNGFLVTMQRHAEFLKSVVTGIVLIIKHPIDIFAAGIYNLTIAIYKAINYMSSFVGMDVGGETLKMLTEERDKIYASMGKTIAGIENAVAAKQAELKTNLSSPVNPLGMPVAPKEMKGNGSTSAYDSLLAGSFAREQAILDANKQQVNLLQKIANNAAGALGAASVTSRSREAVGGVAGAQLAGLGA